MMKFPNLFRRRAKQETTEEPKSEKVPTKEELQQRLTQLKLWREAALNEFISRLADDDHDYFSDIAESNAEAAGRSEPNLDDKLSASLHLAISYEDMSRRRRDLSRYQVEIQDIEDQLAERVPYEPALDMRRALQELSLADLESGEATVMRLDGESILERMLHGYSKKFPDLITGDAVVFGDKNNATKFITYGYFDKEHIAGAVKELEDLVKEMITEHPLNRP